jgi:nicotinamidase-related amidase
MVSYYEKKKSLEVPEIPIRDRVMLPAQRTALIVVDMQNDFVSEGGNLLVPEAVQTIPKIKSLLQRARDAGTKVAFSQDTSFEGDPEWDIWPKHCEQGTWGWQIIDELKPLEPELICVKNRYDAFYGTWLDHFLRTIWHVEHLVIVGTVSNICVLHTAASAGLRWYKIVVPANGISALTDFDQAATLRQITSLYAGDVVRDTADIGFE